jgi:hypothetical protein
MPLAAPSWPYADLPPRLQIRCMCCAQAREVLATVVGTELVIMARKRDRKKHWVAYSADDIAQWEKTMPLLCACCPPEDSYLLGEWIDDLLVIRRRRNMHLHFVALSKEALHRMLALGQEARYSVRYGIVSRGIVLQKGSSHG